MKIIDIYEIYFCSKDRGFIHARVFIKSQIDKELLNLDDSLIFCFTNGLILDLRPRRLFSQIMNKWNLMTRKLKSHLLWLTQTPLWNKPDLLWNKIQYNAIPLPGGQEGQCYETEIKKKKSRQTLLCKNICKEIRLN